MKKLMSLGVLMAVAVMMVGCSTMTVTSYDKDGKITKVENVSTDIAGSIIQSTKDKTIVMWRSGWAAYISASPGTVQDPTPTGKLFAGKEDEGYVAVQKDMTGKDAINWDGIAKVIAATSKSLNVNMSGAGETPTSNNAVTPPAALGKTVPENAAPVLNLNNETPVK